MKKLSTYCMDSMNNTDKKKQEKKGSPRKQTLDFLSQYARVYCSEKTLSTGHFDFVLN
ncbi:MAG: hypothetical protein PHG27_01370 [Massilibacteroides sp.]|nr:hypothetical protein [Massilibacteroides sp.]MDD3063564.1 hypothetical protein [Massilibacteroides sp.]MDD4114236.1 hypothetical protein [Massilibacteroides sp.]MDD4661047.1 hypothetical protein [Massilibacteroides sp.]